MATKWVLKYDITLSSGSNKTTVIHANNQCGSHNINHNRIDIWIILLVNGVWKGINGKKTTLTLNPSDLKPINYTNEEYWIICITHTLLTSKRWLKLEWVKLHHMHYHRDNHQWVPWSSLNKQHQHWQSYCTVMLGDSQIIGQHSYTIVFTQ